MRPEKYTVRDRWGRKLGTIEPSSGVSGLILFVIAAMVIGVPVLVIMSGISSVASFIHPVMPRTYFSVKDAHIAGPAEYSAGACCYWRREKPDNWNMMQLYPGGYVESALTNNYSDGQFQMFPSVGSNNHYGTVVTLVVNGTKVSELIWGRSGFLVLGDPSYGGHSYRELTVNLRKGVNTIKIINSDQRNGVTLGVEGFYLTDIKCETLLYRFAC